MNKYKSNWVSRLLLILIVGLKAIGSVIYDGSYELNLDKIPLSVMIITIISRGIIGYIDREIREIA